MPRAKNTTNCRISTFERYYFSETLETCIFYQFSACPDRFDPENSQIDYGNSFDDLTECQNVCRMYINPRFPPIVPISRDQPKL